MGPVSDGTDITVKLKVNQAIKGIVEELAAGTPVEVRPANPDAAERRGCSDAAARSFSRTDRRCTNDDAKPLQRPRCVQSRHSDLTWQSWKAGAVLLSTAALSTAE